MSCYRCGAVVHIGEAKVVLGFTADELTEIAFAVGGQTRKRALTALELIDPFRAADVRRELEELR